MEKDLITLRKEALPRGGETLFEFYLKTRPDFPYRERFVELVGEAYDAYVGGGVGQSAV